jgi:RHS repeat-associated protein
MITLKYGKHMATRTKQEARPDPSFYKIVWKWDSAEAFGNSLPNENPSALGAFTYNLRMPGQYFDKETNNFYNWMRDYDPQLGRYVQSDPIGLDGGINTFAYANNDPLGSIDPDGRHPLLVRACAKYPQACAALAACRMNPAKCVELLCKGNNALSRYKVHCEQPGCGEADSPMSLSIKTAAACTCFVNRVFEKYVCRKGKSDSGHDEQIEHARNKCLDCARKCTL